MMKSKELKTEIYSHAHSLILSLSEHTLSLSLCIILVVMMRSKERKISRFVLMLVLSMILSLSRSQNCSSHADSLPIGTRNTRSSTQHKDGVRHSLLIWGGCQTCGECKPWGMRWTVRVLPSSWLELQLWTPSCLNCQSTLRCLLQRKIARTRTRTRTHQTESRTAVVSCCSQRRKCFNVYINNSNKTLECAIARKPRPTRATSRE